MKIKDRINFLNKLISEKQDYLQEIDTINNKTKDIDTTTAILDVDSIEYKMKQTKEEIKQCRDNIIENIDDIDTAERDLLVYKNSTPLTSKQPEIFYNEYVIPFGNKYFYTQLTVIDNKVNNYYSPIYSYICIEVTLYSYILQYEVGLETLLGVLCNDNDDAFKLRLYCRNNSIKNISIFCFTNNNDNNYKEIDISDLKQFGVVSSFANV